MEDDQPDTSEDEAQQAISKELEQTRAAEEAKAKAIKDAILRAKLRRMYPVRQTPCKDPVKADAKRLAAKAERQRRRRAQKRMG
jgi:hypothetical protein